MASLQNLTIEGRAKALPDIQRSWMWEILIPAISDRTGFVMKDVEDLIIRARTCVIPGRSIEAMTSEFMGMKQYFPGKTTFTGTFSTTIEETQDQIVWNALSHWQNQIYLVNPTAVTGGASQRVSKRANTAHVYVNLIKYDGTVMDNQVHFYNCYPQNVGDVTLSYESADQVKFEVTWQYDFWTIESRGQTVS